MNFFNFVSDTNFLRLVFVGFVALFPPVNPIGTAIIVDPLLRSLDMKSRKRAASKIATYCFIICTTTILVGSWLFKLFGISLPVVQLAGGILICKMGWQFLSSDQVEKETDATPNRSPENVEGILFYPLAFPMTTGAGTISVLLTLSAHANSTGALEIYFRNLLSLFVAIISMCALIYWSYAFTPTLLKRLGASGEQIVNRLSAFLVFCVGIQIAVGGINNLLNHR
jgi:multiple antibiotic resistance protein